MPTYDYKCLKCGHQFEVFQTMTEKQLLNCPECGGELKRLIGAGAGPIFKGSGFYQTDYKNSSHKPDKSSTEISSPAASVSKPEKKTSPKTSD